MMESINFGRITGLREDLDWYHVVGSLLIGVLVFLAIGFIAGGYSPPSPPPPIEFSECNAAIVTDSLQRLESKDFEVVTKVFRENLTTGERRPVREQWERVKISHSTGSYWVESLETDDASWEIYRNSYSIWYRVFSNEWQEQDVRLGTELDMAWQGGILADVYNSIGDTDLEDTQWAVISNTSSAITLRSSDQRALTWFTAGRVENASVRIVISKHPTTDLKRVEITQHYPEYRIETVRVVSGIGNTTVRRPEPLPMITVQEFTNRIAIGWKRILPI